MTTASVADCPATTKKTDGNGHPSLASRLVVLSRDLGFTYEGTVSSDGGSTNLYEGEVSIRKECLPDFIGRISGELTLDTNYQVSRYEDHLAKIHVRIAESTNRPYRSGHISIEEGRISTIS